MFEFVLLSCQESIALVKSDQKDDARKFATRSCSSMTLTCPVAVKHSSATD